MKNDGFSDIVIKYYEAFRVPIKVYIFAAIAPVAAQIGGQATEEEKI